MYKQTPSKIINQNKLRMSSW